MRKYSEKFFKKAVISFVIITQVFASLLYARQAKAVLLPVSDFHWDIKRVEDSIEKSLLASATQALLSGITYFANKFAYDSAVYLSSSAKGQKPVIFQDGFGSYLQKTLEESAMTAVGDLGNNYGVNLCEPNLEIQIFLNIGIQNLLLPEIGPPIPPPCTFQEFKNNWSNAYYEAKNQLAGILDAPPIEIAFVDSLNIEDTDFGIALGAISLVRRKVEQDTEGAKNQRLESQGIKPKTSPITDSIVTPWQTYAEAIKDVTPTAVKQNGLEGAGWAVQQGTLASLVSASGIFLNNLASQLLNHVFTNGLFPDSPREGVGSTGGFGSSNIGSYRRAAEAAFSFFFTSVPAKQLNAYDVLTEFAACPENPGLNNCVVDSGLQRALQIAKQGTPLTLQEAVGQGLLDPNKPFISPRRLIDHNDVKTCYLKGYCYSNLQKLRKAAILPIGFELAALKSDPDNLRNWTLGKVMAGFEDCAYDENDNVVMDNDHPFCHLIDPNWVLKVSETRCESLVYGPELVDSSFANRRQECVDVSTCVSEGPNGECLGDYGYCTQEKNVWRIEGDTCPAEYATCKTYVSQNGQVDSYLSRTVDFGECTVDSVGCRAYSLEQKAGSWVSSASIDLGLKDFGRNQTVYFGGDISGQTCPADSEGCSAFYEINSNGEQTTDLAYLKKAPDYLGCYDTNLATLEIDWPKTKADLNLLTTDTACGAFAQACIPSEVGCEGYTPVQGGEEIPGVIGNNVCSSSCVGYDVFRQEVSVFEAQKYPLYLIPENGEVCSAQYVGCTEFTNIEASTSGGESLEYYSDFKQCEKPNETNDKVFYSWEGSVTEGFVLRVHHLAPVDSARKSYVQNLSIASAIKDDLSVGSPAYVNDTASALEENYSSCNETNYNILINDPSNTSRASEDCRAFYDEDGSVYYRLFAETITVSGSCHSIRKTNLELFTDTSLTTQNLCETKGGVWGSSGCERCFNGGRYENGACVYQTIASPGESTACPASANECRAYVGNAGNNIRQVFFDTFEPVGTSSDALTAAFAGWSTPSGTGLSVVGEAIQAGLHSLQVGGQRLVRNFEAGELTPGTFYELSFWARGNNQNLKISLVEDSNEVSVLTYNIATKSEVLLSVGDIWKEYVLGPVEYVGNGSAPASLVFESSGIGGTVPGTYFIDNVKVTQVQDFVYLIKDSWKTSEGYDAPLACDNNPNDNLPGLALGCRAYNDRENTVHYTTGFESLCRPKAIGCEPLIDTFNTVNTADAANAQIFNAWCPGSSNTDCKITVQAVPQRSGQEGIVAGDTAPRAVAVETELGSCHIEQGKSGCYIDKITLPLTVDISSVSSKNIVSSTVIIPADTSIETPVYLTNTREYACTSNRLGCQKVAQETKVLPSNQQQAFEFNEMYVLNNPNNYADILCSSKEVGCSEYRSDESINYFVDPNITGNTSCVYKKAGSLGNGSDNFGWVLDGIGICSDVNRDYCRTNSDCADGVLCVNVGSVACYPNYVNQGGEYGIWSNESDSYSGFVGQCEAQYNSCVEFIDHADTSNNSVGESYYVIYNDKMKDLAKECEGQISLKEGCVLFDRTDVPNKVYNSSGTYVASENADPKFSFVSPVTIGIKDTNTILKVGRDRQCSEWLACKSSVPFTNEKGVKSELCYQYDLCEKSLPGVGCVSWVDSGDVSQRLTAEDYITRGTSWYDREYTGFSLLEKYPIQDYTYVSIDLSDSSDASLKQEYGSKLFLGSEFIAPDGFESFDCVQDAGETDAPNPGQIRKDFTRCGFNSGGLCFSGQCVYPIDGVFPSSIVAVDSKRDVLELLDVGICKSYPEVNSPFDLNLVASSYDNVTNGDVVGSRSIVRSKKTIFSGANVCQGNDCSCEYKKVSYGESVVDYLPFVNKNVVEPVGICSGGQLDGYPCSSDLNCKTINASGEVSSIGSCLLKTTTERRIGQRGFCLEYDLSRPIGNGQYACLTWLPIDTSASKIDLHNFRPEAGYYPVPEYDAPNGGGEVYCTESTARGAGEYDANMYVFTKPDTVSGIDNVDIGLATFGESFTTNGKELDSAEIGGFLSLTFTASPYESTIENSSTDKEEAYSMMQLWAWKFIDTSARILRLELKNGTDEDYGYKVNGTQYSQFGLIPSVIQDSGVSMHPPRVWGENQVTGFGREFLSYTGTSGGVAQYAKRTIYTDALSAAEVAGYDSYLYASPVERTLREEELREVYFVGLRHPGSVGKGITPPLLSTALKLDIKQLKLRADDNESRNEYIFYNNIAQKIGDGVYDMADNYLGAEWTYVLERSDKSKAGCHGLLSYCDYMTSGYIVPSSSKIATSTLDARNEVYRRYVTVYFASEIDHMPSFVNKNGIPFSEDQDPFSVNCTPGSYKNNWIAIGMDFNKDGEFLGYITRNCDDKSSSAYNGLEIATIATLNDYCVELSSVYNSNADIASGESTNKAWTDRVWRYSNKHVLFDPYAGVLVDTVLRPFGSISLPYSKLIEYLPLGDLFKKYIFDVSDSGISYLCGLTSRLNAFNMEALSCKALSYVGYSDNLVRELSQAASRSSDLVGVNALKSLFAKVEITNISNPGAVSTTTDQSVSAIRTGIDQALKISQEDRELYAPRIYSLNPNTCFNTNGRSTTCVAAEFNAFTVNGKNATTADYNGDGRADEDLDRNGSPDGIIGVGSKGISVNFFAWADDNRMPIRRVMVDWADGSLIANKDKTGFYKNRKPFCGDNLGTSVNVCGLPVTVPGFDAIVYQSIGLTCEENSDCVFARSDSLCVSKGSEFGNSTRACEEGYFEFSHSYTCGSKEQANSNIYKPVSSLPLAQREELSKFGVGSSDFVCVFKPRVQVLDNWGWCNTADGGGEYNDNGLNLCDHTKSDSTTWTSYKGDIIVIPE